MKKKAKQQQGFMPVLLFVGALFVALGLGLGIRYAMMSSGDGGVQTPATIGGPFELIDQAGNAVTDTSYRGKYLLIYFGYTFCPDVCPTSLGTMAGALNAIPQETAAKIQPLMITLDPERDTKERLAEFVTAFYPGMAGLTGSPDQVAAVARAFRVYYAKVDSSDPNIGYLIDHSALFYLMGPDGRFIRHFSHGVQPSDMAAALTESVK